VDILSHGLSAQYTHGVDIIDLMLRKIATMKTSKSCLIRHLKDSSGDNGRRVEPESRTDWTITTKFCFVKRSCDCVRRICQRADVQFRSVQNPSFGESVMTTNQPGATAEALKEAFKDYAMFGPVESDSIGTLTRPDERWDLARQHLSLFL
jgi:hypothetical protein